MLFEKGKEAINLAKFSIITSILEKSLNFILIPIYTSFLSPADYGVLGLLIVSTTWMENFINAPVTNGITRGYYDPAYKKDLWSIIFSGYSFILLQLFLVFTIYLSMVDQFSIFVLGSMDYINEAKLFCWVIIFLPIANTTESLIRVKGRAKRIAITNLNKFIIVGCLQIFMLIKLSFGIKAMIVGLIIGSLIKIFSYSFLIIKNLKFNFKFTYLKSLLGYGYPLVIASISGGTLAFLERYLIRENIDLHNVGIYSFAITISSLVYILFTTPLKFSYVPIIYKMEDQPKNQRYLVSKFCNYSMAYALFIWLIISLNSNIIVKLLASDAQFYPSSSLVPQLGLLGVFLGLSTFVSNGLTMKRKAFTVSLIATSKLIISSVLLIIFIPKYGLLGAAYSLCLSNFINILIKGYSSKAYYGQTFEVKKLIFVFSLAIFVFVISSYMKIFSDNIYIELLINFIALAVYLLIILFSAFITKNERTQFFFYVRKFSLNIAR